MLVFDHIQQVYRDFINELETLFKEAGLAEVEDLTDEELDVLWEFVIAEYFAGYDNVLPGYRDQDVKDILRYYAQKDVFPTFLKFEDREKCDLAKEARYIFEHLRVKDKPEYIESLWNDENGFWRVLFGYRKDYFIRQLSIEEEKLWGPKPEERKEIQIKFDEVDIARLPLSEIIKTHRAYWRNLHDGVFAKHTNLSGSVTCACCGLQSKYKIHFQIDHIVPLSKGGLSKIDNLQILCRTCNAIKSDQTINFQGHEFQDYKTSSSSEFLDFAPPQDEKVRDNKEWERYLRRRINFFYQCSAVDSININLEKWHVLLYPANNPHWLRPHLENLVRQIREAGFHTLTAIKINSSDYQLGPEYSIPHSPTAVSNSAALSINQFPPQAKTSAIVESKIIKKELEFIPDGTLCHFRYKGKLHEGKISKGQLVVPRKGQFSSFSTASKAIVGYSRNGWLDWQLQLPGTNTWIKADDWRKNAEVISNDSNQN
ncbi:MAG: DUF4357 domain-containing protein [Anaerolineales bacterium]|nr:DUF4357 domain-containing protein [Anaerolineales bacterium]